MVEWRSMRPRLGLSWAAYALVLITAGCSAKGRVATAPPPAPKPVAAAEQRPAPPLQPPRDAVSDLIALSNQHFDAAQRELQSGHLETAKAGFARAVGVLQESPYSVRYEPRLRDHHDRLVARIGA